MQGRDGVTYLRPGWRELACFTAIAALGYLIQLVPHPPRKLDEFLLSLGLTVAAVAWAAVSVRRAQQSWVDPVAQWLALLAFVPLRDATGGVGSALTPLVVLPVLWVALFCRPRLLVVTIGLLAADLIGPLVLSSGESATAWRSALLWCAVAAFLSPTVQVLVRRVAERSFELEVAEARWRGVMEHLPDATVMVLEPDTTIDLVTGNGAMRQGMSGHVGRRLSDVSGRNGAELTRLVAAAANGQDATAELLSSQVGEEHEVHLARLPIRRHGAASQVLLVARNVSVERAYRRELEMARDAAEQLFAHSPQPVAVVGLDGELVRVNAAFAQLFDTRTDELIGRQLEGLGDGGDTTIREHLNEVITASVHELRTQWQLHRAGKVLHLVVTSTLLAGGTTDSERHILMTAVDVSERHEHEQALAHLADHDPLTGLVNRRRFNTQLVQHVEFCRRYGQRGALLLLDLDHFKEVNDTLGHAAGDQLIISVASLLRRAVRSSDIVARLGGDEFAILAQETDRAGAETVARTVVETVREHVATLEGNHRHVTASVGVVVLGDDAKDAADLLSDADMTMYDAKEAGRDQYAVLDYHTPERPRTANRMAWTERIDRAIENDHFELHLQPVQDVRSGRIVGAEALIRLADTADLVYPGEFLYIAERSDLIVRLDRWVLRRSAALLAELQVVDPDFRLEVNLSGRSMGRPEIEDTLREALADHGADPRGLVLEITETVAVAQVDVARAFAERVHAMGCTFALDDFGAGFGSFYYLKHLLFDYVKIDGEFVAQIHRNPIDRSIVRSVVALAHDLNKTVVAEFVCNSAVQQAIAEEGVDLAQGFEIGRPQPSNLFLHDLQSRLAHS